LLPQRRVALRTSAYVSIRQHTSTYVAPVHMLLKRQLLPQRRVALRERSRSSVRLLLRQRCCCVRQLCLHTSAYVSIRQHMRGLPPAPLALLLRAGDVPAYVSIRQLTSAYVSIRQHTSAYVSIRSSSSPALLLRAGAVPAHAPIASLCLY
jgi:hypothetical protein